MIKIMDDLTFNQLFDGAKFIQRYNELDSHQQNKVRLCFALIQDVGTLNNRRKECIDYLIEIFQPIFRFKSEIKVVNEEIDITNIVSDHLCDISQGW